MEAYKAKFDKAGRILIPAGCRKALGMKSGDHLIIVLEEDSLRITTAGGALKEARRILGLPRAGRSLTEELIQERREEAGRE